MIRKSMELPKMISPLGDTPPGVITEGEDEEIPYFEILTILIDIRRDEGVELKPSEQEQQADETKPVTKRTDSSGNAIEDVLVQGENAMNTAHNQSAAYSAAYPTFWRDLRTTDDITHDFREVVTSESFAAEVTPKLSATANTLRRVKENSQANQRRNQLYTNPRRRADPGYQPSDRIRVTTHHLSNASKQFTAKFAPKRDGPYIILQQQCPASYEIASTTNPGVPVGTHHTSNLTLVNTEDDSPIQPVHPIRKRGRPRKQ